MSRHALFDEPDVSAIMNPDGSPKFELIGDTTEALLFRHAKMAFDGGFGAALDVVTAGLDLLDTLPPTAGSGWTKLVRFTIFTCVATAWNKSVGAMDTLRAGRTQGRQTSFAVAISGQYCVDLGGNFIVGLDALSQVLSANGWRLADITPYGVVVPTADASERFGEYVIAITR